MIDGTAVAQQTAVVLGTATPGGGFPLYGAAFAESVNETDPSLAVEPRNTKGSIENVPLLEAESLDIALVQGEVAYEAFAGIGRPRTDLKITAMYSTPGAFVVRADSPFHAIGDLVGKKVAFGASGSGLVILARYVLDGIGIGLDRDKDFEAVYLDRAGDGPAMVLDGRIAALSGGGTDWPGFTAVAGAPGGARFITPTAEAGGAHPRQACLPQTANGCRRHLSRAKRGNRLGWIVELRAGAANPRRRHRLSSGPSPPPRRDGAGQASATSARDDRGEHGGSGAEPRAYSSRSAALSARGRHRALKGPLVPPVGVEPT